MNIVFLCLSLLAGTCAWGFLIAAAVSFYDPEDLSARNIRRYLFVIDILLIGMPTTVFMILWNWKRKQEARHLFYKGFACLAVAVGFGCICLCVP